jgi:hypothetical protein
MQIKFAIRKKTKDDDWRLQARVSQTCLEILATSHKPVDFSGCSTAHRCKGHHTAKPKPKPYRDICTPKTGECLQEQKTREPRRLSIADANAGELTLDYFDSCTGPTCQPVRSREVCSGEGMIRPLSLSSVPKPTKKQRSRASCSTPHHLSYLLAVFILHFLSFCSIILRFQYCC